MDCVFCQIASGKIPSDMAYQDEEIVAFRDIKPLAPVHLIITPRRHIPSLVHLSEADFPLVGRMVAVANRLAKEEGVADSGYRLVINCGKEGGQVVLHLHMHLIGGRTLSGRPG